jgi:hypothetical protein
MTTWPHDQSMDKGYHLGLGTGHMALHMTRSLENRGVCPIFWKKWVFKLIIGFFNIFRPDFNGILPIFEDLEPRLRPDLGRKLGCDPQLKFYINQVFLQP